jgi:L-ascorbate metabolism protein UlaG (beta-lactamase superfamily)
VFKAIGDLYGPFDFAAIPIGAYKPEWFMKDVHCNPQEAIQIHKDLRSRRSAAIHWGTFPLADEHCVEPALELARCRDLAAVPFDQFFTMKHGDTFLFDDPKILNDFASQLYPNILNHYLKSL